MLKEEESIIIIANLKVLGCMKVAVAQSFELSKQNTHFSILWEQDDFFNAHLRYKSMS